MATSLSQAPPRDAGEKSNNENHSPIVMDSSCSSRSEGAGEGRFLEGLLVCFAGGLQSGQVKIWKDRVPAFGGRVYNHKKRKASAQGFPMPDPPSPPAIFPPEVTHIVAPDSFHNNLAKLLQTLSASSIAPTTKVRGGRRGKGPWTSRESGAVKSRETMGITRAFPAYI